jgi:predicted choloylglycine hydrolase
LFDKCSANQEKNLSEVFAMLRPRSVALIAFLLGTCVPPSVSAAEPFRYPEARYGKGELKYINGLPVLSVAGTPEEIGEQIGILAAKPAARVLNYPEDLLKHYHLHFTWQSFAKRGRQMVERFPVDYQKELNALAQAAGAERERLIVGNTLFDLKKMLACSALLVEAYHSATHGPLLGRNLDYPSLGYAHEYSLVTVYRPEGKHAFVSVGFPGLIGCLSGMNDTGLAVAVLEVYAVKDHAERSDPSGLPYAICYRRLLEECTTRAEAIQALEKMKRTTITNLVVADKDGIAVLEVTPKRVVVRAAEKGVGVCTNHFCTTELRPPNQTNFLKTLRRYETLEEARQTPQLDLSDLHRKLHAVNQKDHTLQTMIFEPATRRLHLAIGAAPSSGQELKRLDLDTFFQNTPAVNGPKTTRK